MGRKPLCVIKPSTMFPRLSDRFGAWPGACFPAPARAYNAGMRVHHDLLDAVEHLPEESVLVLEGVTWEEYEQLLEELPESRGFRVTYDSGRLDVVTHSYRHERSKEVILGLVDVL